METLDVVYKDIALLKPYENNARIHPKKQIQQLANCIQQFGFLVPVLIDAEGGIIAGHARVLAAHDLGMNKIPCIPVEHLTDAQRRAFIIADNKLAANSVWDNSILAAEFEILQGLDLDFELEITGFEANEISLILDAHGAGDDITDDCAAGVDQSKPAVTQPGDLWQLGPHRLHCGNSLIEDSYALLLEGQTADLVFTDPPYNVPIDGHVGGKGAIKHREFAMAAGEMSQQQFTEFLTTVCKLMKSHSMNGSIHYICMDWRHMSELLAAGSEAGYQLKNLCVWVKNNGGMGSLYRSRHELVFVFKNGDAPHINNVELGKNGRYRTNVWEYAGMSSIGNSRDEELALHPTVKPASMVADAIKDCSKRGGIILDPFGGSGSTLMAAQQTGRIARLIELDPHYCDVIIRRWEKLGKGEAINTVTGKTFKQSGGSNVG